jgi:glycosyltransferase involved in cell wall biosynthesis
VPVVDPSGRRCSMSVTEDTLSAADPPLRSLHVIASDARRGAETYAVQLTEALSHRGHEAEVVALVGTGEPTAHDVAVLGGSRRSPRTLRHLRSRASAVDVVVAHGSSTLEACASGLIRLRTPFVYRTIGDPSYWVTTAARQRVVGVMLRRARRHVALWDGAAEQLASRYHIPRDRIDVIPNAVPATGVRVATDGERDAARGRFGIPRGAVCLAYVGALSPEKAVDTAVDACASIEGSHLLVAGDGPEGAALRQYAHRVAAGRVRFLGQLVTPEEVYAACDLLLLPSRSEGMPAVAIEAALRGRATVATAVGSLPEIIDDGRTGFLVAPTDRPRFADGVRAALVGAPAAGQRAAASFGARFTMELSVDLWTASLRCASRFAEPR